MVDLAIAMVVLVVDIRFVSLFRRFGFVCKSELLLYFTVPFKFAGKIVGPEHRGIYTAGTVGLIDLSPARVLQRETWNVEVVGRI